MPSTKHKRGVRKAAINRDSPRTETPLGMPWRLRGRFEGKESLRTDRAIPVGRHESGFHRACSPGLYEAGIHVLGSIAFIHYYFLTSLSCQILCGVTHDLMMGVKRDHEERYQST